MGRKVKKQTPMICEGQIKIPYGWPAGSIGSHFLRALCDQKQILGLRCSSCRKVLVPPTRCLDCDQVGTEWVQVGPQGILESWTMVRTPVRVIQVLRVPYGVGVIRLDGADSSLVHLVSGADVGKLRTGIRLEPVFNEERRGHILDIRYFQPVTQR
jgi:uncharacterized OB-fold protein